MNSEELRKACEMAGGRMFWCKAVPWETAVPVWEFHECELPESHDALKPYVAELLTAKVRKRGEDVLDSMSFELAVLMQQNDADTVSGALWAWERATAE